MTYCALCLMKNGIATPKIISEDNFATAMPSSLFDESVKISNEMIVPCNVPPDASNIMSIGERDVKLKTGSRATVIKNAKTAGTPNRAAR